MKKLVKKIAQFTVTGWGVLVVSAVSLILGLIAASPGKWNGLAYGIWFLGLLVWCLLMNGNYFKKE